MKIIPSLVLSKLDMYLIKKKKLQIPANKNNFCKESRYKDVSLTMAERFNRIKEPYNTLSFMLRMVRLVDFM